MENAKRTQANRLLAISTPLGADVLLLKSFHMTEELGRPFTCELDLRSEDSEIDFHKLLGANCTIRLMQTDGATRYINGHISRLVQEGKPEAGQANQYRAILVPWLWFLTRTSDCRIFQNKSIPDIVQEVFRDFNFTSFELRLTETYSPREFVVQYRETAFNFVSRLMEEVGIYYFFVHADGEHKLILCDSPSAHETIPGYETIPYVQQKRGNVGRERVWDWVLERQFQPSSFMVRDFNFKTPGTVLEDEVKVTPPSVGIQGVIYDYPGGFDKPEGGKTVSTLRGQEHVAQAETCRARADTRGLTVGAKFKLEGFSREDQNRDYIVTSMHAHAETDDYSAGAGSETELYQCGFTAIEASVPFRSQRLTPRPVIGGPQTAIVVGKSGETIWPDEFGRVKVQFHWDREGKGDENASCWLRVAQLWAGKSWGGMFIPRVGQEVVVEFLEGDPDRPLITGRLYNATATVPYALPNNKTMSTIKSCSAGSDGGFNEMRFEDKAGSEQFFIHAQKNLDVRVLHDRFENIGHDRHLVVENDKFEHIKNDRHELIDRDHKENIKRDRHVNVVGKEAVKIAKSKSLTVEEDVIEVFKKNQSTQVTKEVFIKADTIILEAATNITFKVGGSWIALDSSSIDSKTTNATHKTDAAFKIEATSNFEAKGTAGAKLESAATVDVKGLATNIKADAACTVKGATTAIG